MQTIAILNQSSKVGHSDLVALRQALQVQVERDFGPLWGAYAQIQIGVTPKPYQPVLFLLDNSYVADALGYHAASTGAPEGFVFVQTALDDGIPWQSVVSHEILEMLADPWTDLVADTWYPDKEALVAYEVCDPVELDFYHIGSVPVSNFVLPGWFLPQPLPETPQTDFLKHLQAPLAVSPGGYFYYANQIGQWQGVFGSKVRDQGKKPSPYSRRFRRLNLHPVKKVPKS